MLLEPGAKRCERHTEPRAYDGRGSLGYSLASYKRARAAYLARHRTCETCHRQPATTVHHLDGLGPRGPHGADAGNFRAMCASCHNRITATLHRPGTRAERFANRPKGAA